MPRPFFDRANTPLVCDRRSGQFFDLKPSLDQLLSKRAKGVVTQMARGAEWLTKGVAEVASPQREFASERL